MVVIAIIGLLSTLSILALNQARARARDAKRISDVRQIQTALEMYYNDAGYYPPSQKSGIIEGPIGFNSNTYLANMPRPPKPMDGANCVSYADYGLPLGYDIYKNYLYFLPEHSPGPLPEGSEYGIFYCLGSDVNNVAGDNVQVATNLTITSSCGWLCGLVP